MPEKKKALKNKLQDCQKDDLFSFCIHNNLEVKSGSGKDHLVKTILSHYRFLQNLSKKETLSNSWPY
jgi:hypothetical protein